MDLSRNILGVHGILPHRAGPSRDCNTRLPFTTNHHLILMRILSPTLDVRTPAPSEDESRKSDSTANEGAATNPNAPSIAVPASKIPTVVLDTDVVSDNMAARLCISFLGHLLFLKNQVPFPIVQLTSMPTKDNTTRIAKKRHELLNSFDTLASHLYTTFIALSSALALRGSPEKAEAGSNASPSSYHGKHGVARAFFAVALGPTVGSARARVMVGIDGLETKVWGLREDDAATRDVSEESDHDSVESESDPEDEDEQSDEEEGDDEGHGSETDDNAPPPPSRSPSPVPSDSDSLVSTPSLEVPSTSSKQQAEDPETVRAAERLLSRTLASACAEDDGEGLASEMAPTQIHVLLRAPRRFDHPSWIPRQNLSASLDNYLADFLVESGLTPASSETSTKKKTKTSKVQGVWVKSRASTRSENSEEGLAEEDELIWWSWDGKLVGFAGW
ncbi:hypothetical protein JVU11DRAFT_10131 [Chiua virens]|nr:hypothetical protein JVU11DRAFT_10131 [Chiua virens]